MQWIESRLYDQTFGPTWCWKKMLDHFSREFIPYVSLMFPVNHKPIQCRTTVCSAFKEKVQVDILGSPLKYMLQLKVHVQYLVTNENLFVSGKFSKWVF